MVPVEPAARRSHERGEGGGGDSPASRRRPPPGSGLLGGLLLAVALGACSAAGACDGLEAGIAVVVESASGELAPGIFDGSPESARERGGDDLRFAEGDEGVCVVPVDRTWVLAGEAAGTDTPSGAATAGGLAIVVPRADGTAAPGAFRGPAGLARRIAASSPDGGARDPSDDPFGLVIGEAHSRVLAFPPGSRVTMEPPGTD